MSERPNQPQPRENRGPGPHGGFSRRERPQDVKGTLKRILKYMLAYRWQLAVVMLCVAVSALSGAAGTYFLKPIINDYVVPLIGQNNPDLSGFIRLLAIMGAIYAAGVTATYIYSRLMVTISTAVLRQVRTDMFDHMLLLPLKYYDTHTHGEIMSRYTNDTDTLREMLSQGIPQFLSSLLSVVSVFIMMLILSPILTTLIVAMLLVMIVAIRLVGGRSAGFFIRQQRELGALNGYIEEMISGVKVVKVFSHEQVSKQEFAELNDRVYGAAKSAHTFANILMPIMGNLSYLNYAVTAAVGAALAIAGRIDLGTIGSFLQYTRSFSMPLVQISQQFNSILTALSGAERIFRLLDEPADADSGTVRLVNASIAADGSISESPVRTGIWAWRQGPQPTSRASHLRDNGNPTTRQGLAEDYEKERQGDDDGGENISYTLLKGDVRFNDVVFGYEPGQVVLKRISLYAKPGQKIAFVGATGAGKTTITNLINRFYEIQEGSITYDGIDIRRIAKPELLRSLGMVLQDTRLFTGTVLENIRYGRLDATDEECMAAARLANADHFIRQLPAGYDTVLSGDGGNLSQGQRQLLSIARAAVADPPVLILDEATSSIDTRTEAMIEKGMDHLMEGRTVFVIAHRLSTVRNAKAILVLEQGEIIERGGHEELLAQKGRYYQLYTGSFELE